MINNLFYCFKSCSGLLFGCFTNCIYLPNIRTSKSIDIFIYLSIIKVITQKVEKFYFTVIILLE
jgi:hypothetical protein